MQAMRCSKCGEPAERQIFDMKEINGGYVKGEEDLPPMIHKEWVPVTLCEKHMREPKTIPNEELRKLRAERLAALNAAE